MPLPPIATIAACGSIMTAVKSGWELSRMIKKKDAENQLESYARSLLKDLRNVHLDGLMDRKSFDRWYDRFLGALAEKDMMEMRKIRQHVNLVYRDRDRISRRNSTANQSSSSSNHHHHHHHSDEKRSSNHHHRRAHSADRRTSSSSRGPPPPPAYTVEEWESSEEHHRRRPGKLDTRKAQRDYYYSHALPSPYRGELEYTPKAAEFDLDSDKDFSQRNHRSRSSRGHSRHDSRGGSTSRKETMSRSHSTSTVERGRTRSRSVHTEQRIVESPSEYDSDREREDDSDTKYPRRRQQRRDSYLSTSESTAGRGERPARGR